jgi:predicted nuclease with TOPRIM domain
MNQMPNLSDSEVATLTNALMVAADKFKANAKEFRDLKPQLEQQEAEDPDRMSFIHSSACDSLADQFDRQATEVTNLRWKIEEFIDEELAEAA